jgi:hypothetical protein
MRLVDGVGRFQRGEKERERERRGGKRTYGVQILDSCVQSIHERWQNFGGVDV